MKDGGVEQNDGPATTSPSLLARVRADDPAGWRRLVDLYGPLVYRWCTRFGLGPEDAADVGQDVFLVLARKVGSFRRERPGDSFRGWLFVITRNKARDLIEGRRERGAGGSGGAALELAPAPADDEASVHDDRRLLVHRAMDLVRRDVAPATWEAFWRTTVDGRQVDDVATELGLTRDAVYIARSRVRRRLEGEFGELVEFQARGAAAGAR